MLCYKLFSTCFSLPLFMVANVCPAHFCATSRNSHSFLTLSIFSVISVFYLAINLQPSSLHLSEHSENQT